MYLCIMVKLHRKRNGLTFKKKKSLLGLAYLLHDKHVLGASCSVEVNQLARLCGLNARCGNMHQPWSFESTFISAFIDRLAALGARSELSLHHKKKGIKHIYLFYEETPSHGPIPP